VRISHLRVLPGVLLQRLSQRPSTASKDARKNSQVWYYHCTRLWIIASYYMNYGHVTQTILATSRPLAGPAAAQAGQAKNCALSSVYLGIGLCSNSSFAITSHWNLETHQLKSPNLLNFAIVLIPFSIQVNLILTFMPLWYNFPTFFPSQSCTWHLVYAWPCLNLHKKIRRWGIAFQSHPYWVTLLYLNPDGNKYHILSVRANWQRLKTLPNFSARKFFLGIGFVVVVIAVG